MRSGRRMFGLRERPGLLALAVFRIPVLMFRLGLGGLLGTTFVLLTHVGRRTGRPHDAVLMVIGREDATGTIYVCSAWGPGSDWLRNVQAAPPLGGQVGTWHFRPAVRFPAPAESRLAVDRFRRDHAARWRLFRTILGWPALATDAEVDAFVRTHPVVALVPTVPAPAAVDAARPEMQPA